MRTPPPSPYHEPVCPGAPRCVAECPLEHPLARRSPSPQEEASPPSAQLRSVRRRGAHPAESLGIKHPPDLRREVIPCQEASTLMSWSGHPPGNAAPPLYHSRTPLYLSLI